ncbi:diguanylate cyclase regulator RdcB family protein [Shigella flexneri]
MIFTRWRAGAYERLVVTWTPFCCAGGVWRWGAFGGHGRLANAECGVNAEDNLRTMAAQALADSVNAAPVTRHYYHHWLSNASCRRIGEYNDMLSWLGDWCDAQRHPVSGR